MAEYINKETARSVIMGQPTDAHYPDWYAAQIKEIEPVDVAPVVHAHWIRTNSGKWRCSACRGRHDYPMRYCGECGARMNERRTDNG